jgi:hypothetical protein
MIRPNVDAYRCRGAPSARPCVAMRRIPPPAPRSARPRRHAGQSPDPAICVRCVRAATAAACRVLPVATAGAAPAIASVAPPRAERPPSSSVEDIMPTLDSQVHAYERNHPGRPWVSTLTGPEEVTGDQMVAAMEMTGASGASRPEPSTNSRRKSGTCRTGADIHTATPANEELGSARAEAVRVRRVTSPWPRSRPTHVDRWSCVCCGRCRNAQPQARSGVSSGAWDRRKCSARLPQ